VFCRFRIKNVTFLFPVGHLKNGDCYAEFGLDSERWILTSVRRLKSKHQLAVTTSQ